MRPGTRTGLQRLAVSVLCAVSIRPASLRQSSARVHSRAQAPAGMSTQRRYPQPLVQPAAKQHKSTVIIIHGLGDSGAGWAGFGPELSPGLPHTKFIFPTASQLPVSLNGGMRANSWYDIYDLERLTDRQDVESLHASAGYIESLVQQEIDGGIDSKKIVVAGFSQGGVIALLGLRQQRPLAGILSMSGYLLLQAEPPLFSEANAATPTLLCHGEADPVVAFRFGLEARDGLQAAGKEVTFISYPAVGHTLAPKEIEDVRTFLKSCLY